MCVLGSPLGDGSGISVHYAIRPAGAKGYEGVVILVLVENLVSMVLTGVAAGVRGTPLAIPDAIDFKEVITPGHLIGCFLSSYRIGDHVTPLFG